MALHRCDARHKVPRGAWFPATESPRPVGGCHKVAVGCACGIDVVGSLFEFLAQVEYLLFQLADAGTQCLGIVGAPDSAGAEDLLAEYLRQPGGEVGVLLPQPPVLLPEVGKVREQGLLAGGCGCRAADGGGGPRMDLGSQVVMP
jgi:hypothetical protein